MTTEWTPRAARRTGQGSCPLSYTYRRPRRGAVGKRRPLSLRHHVDECEKDSIPKGNHARPISALPVLRQAELDHTFCSRVSDLDLAKNRISIICEAGRRSSVLDGKDPHNRNEDRF